jgi:dCTP deaminase
MAFWSGSRLIATPSVVEPFVANQVDCNAYTLRMGGVYYRTGEQKAGYEQKKTSLTSGEAFLIPAGQFAFLLSKETVIIPEDAMAFISMKTGIKFQGLINVSGFHVDPGYKGKLIYAVYNASPAAIQICEGDLIFKIWFCDLKGDFAPEYIFSGKGLFDISGEMIKGMNKEIYSLQSLAEKIRDQQAAIEAKFAEQKPVIDNLTLVWRTAVMGVIGALLVALLTFALPSAWHLGERFVRLWSANGLAGREARSSTPSMLQPTPQTRQPTSPPATVPKQQ